MNITPLYLTNISKVFWDDNVKKIGLYRYVFEFSFDCGNIVVINVYDFHKYLIYKNNIN